jgi:hypothetical protein
VGTCHSIALEKSPLRTTVSRLGKAHGQKGTDRGYVLGPSTRRLTRRAGRGGPRSRAHTSRRIDAAMGYVAGRATLASPGGIAPHHRGVRTGAPLGGPAAVERRNSPSGCISSQNVYENKRDIKLIGALPEILHECYRKIRHLPHDARMLLKGKEKDVALDVHKVDNRHRKGQPMRNISP